MDFEYEIKYKKGTLNSNADALSRIVYENNDPENTHSINQLTEEDLTVENCKGFYQSKLHTPEAKSTKEPIKKIKKTL